MTTQSYLQGRLDALGYASPSGASPAYLQGLLDSLRQDKGAPKGEKRECGKGWEGTWPGGCKRIGKGGATSKAQPATAPEQTSKDPYKAAADELLKDPTTRTVLGMIVKGASGNAIAKATGLNKEQLLQVAGKARAAIGTQPGQRISDRLKELYAKPKTAPAAEEKPAKKAKGKTTTKSAQVKQAPAGVEDEPKPKRQRKSKAKPATESPKTESKVKHKPFMTEAEALEYTKDSAYKVSLYHGTSKVGADSITRDGVNVDRNTTAVYGAGFYTTSDRSAASEYARGNDRKSPAVLEMRLLIRKPRVFKNMNEFMAFKKENGLDPFEAGLEAARKTTKLLQDKGFDGIEIKNMKYIIAFEPEQVAIFKRTGK